MKFMPAVVSVTTVTTYHYRRAYCDLASFLSLLIHYP